MVKKRLGEAPYELIYDSGTKETEYGIYHPNHMMSSGILNINIK